MYMPNSFSYEGITKALKKLCETLNVPMPDYAGRIQLCEDALKRAKSVIGSMPIALDHNFTGLILSLSRLLVEHGFNLQRIYADTFLPEEYDDFRWLQENAGDIKLYATVHHKMRLMPGDTDEEFIALGQKAAYFTASEHFANVVEGGGMYGFDGICRVCEHIVQAYNEPKDIHIIQRKGLGGVCCL